MLTSDKIHYIIAKQVTERTTNKLSETDKYGILAQLGEHLPYKQRVIGSSPIGSIYLDGFPSGQRGQTVNLLATLSKVRILLHPLRY